MADERFPSHRAGDAAQDGAQGDGQVRGSRSGGSREGGGFRIRLSDNEMQASRALQEAFGLRSTVAVLGFSLRTLAQQLEQGQLNDLIAQQRAQGGDRPAGAREGGREGGRSGEPRRDRGPMESGRGGRARVDPFARPARPASAPAEDAPNENAVAEGAMAEGDAAQGASAEAVAEVEVAQTEPALEGAAEAAGDPPADGVAEATSEPTDAPLEG
jgi:hypothetical protein